MSNPLGAALSSRHERRFRRFGLQYPVHILFFSGQAITEADAVSRNVSAGGLLLECPVPVPQRGAIHFVISLSGRKLRPVKLEGEGTVVRVEPPGAGMDFTVAIECKRPMTQIEPYLPVNLVSN